MANADTICFDHIFMLWHRSILVPGTHLYCVLDTSSSSWTGKKTKKTSGYSMIVMLASLSANQQLSNGTNNFIVNLKCLTFFCCTYIIHSVLLELHYRYQHSLGFVVSSSIWFCLKSKVVVFFFCFFLIFAVLGCMTPCNFTF